MAAVGLAACAALVVGAREDTPAPTAVPAGVAAGALPVPTQPPVPGPRSRPTSGEQLRSALVAALSEHLVLTDRLARAGLRGGPDLTATAEVALQRSSRTWRSVLTDLSGEPSRRAEQASTGAMTAVFAYAAARAEGDAAGALAARARVTAEARTLSEALVDAARGALEAGVTERGLHQYADGLVRHVDAAARGDFVEAYEEERRSYAYASHLGAELADGLSKGLGLPAPSSSASERKRVYLQRLLAEHAALVLDVVAAHARAGPDGAAAAAALKANGTELAWAAGQGRDGRSHRFARLWQGRVGALSTYSRAVASDEHERAREALTELERMRRPIVDLLVSDPSSAASRLLTALHRQDHLVVRQAVELAAAGSAAGPRAFGEALDTGRELGRQVAASLTHTSEAAPAAGGA